MACTVPKKPRPPTVLGFTPWEDAARVGLFAFRDYGTHLDTWIRITRNDDGSIVKNTKLGFAGLHFTFTSIGLVPGEVYLARARVENEIGWSGWSAPVKGKVFSDLDLAEITVPDEPALSALSCPFVPSFVSSPRSSRPMVEKRMATGHLFRRLEHSTDRNEVTMTWAALDAVKFASMLSFLLGVIDGNEAFLFSDTNDDKAGAEQILGGGEALGANRAWFPLRGRIRTRQVGPDAQDITIEAVEVQTDRFFTVGKSLVGGPDPIR